MPRGGLHQGTIKPTWKAGKTTTIRVPEVKKEEIIKLLRALDSLESEGMVIEKNCYEKVIFLLKESLDLKPNAGGKIKEKIKEALALLES
jgi:hypothetical protein